MNQKQEKLNRIKQLLMGKQFAMLLEEMKSLTGAISKKPEPHIQVVVPPQINVNNLSDVPTDIKVKNFPDLQKVLIQNEKDIQVFVKNHKEVQKVEVTNIREKDVQKVELTNAEKASGWVPTVVAHAVKGIAEVWVKLWNRGITVKLDADERLKPLPVIVVDVRGRPVNFNAQGQIVVSGGFMPGAQTHGGVIPTGTTIGAGRKTVTTAGTAEKLIAASTPCRKVILTAIPTNTGTVAIGDSSALATAGSERGVQLIGSFAREEIEIDDVSKIWIDASTNGEGVSFTYLR